MFLESILFEKSQNFKIQFCPVLAAQSQVCQVASLSRIFASHFWWLVREWKAQSRGSLRDFRGSARDLLAGRPSSREKHLEKFSNFCSWVLWRLELATVWRLNQVAKNACFTKIRAVFKSFSVFPSNICDCSSSPSQTLRAPISNLHCCILVAQNLQVTGMGFQFRTLF